MATLTVDDRKRVRIPTAKPKQVFSFQPNADGSVLLVPVQEKEPTELFPPGSLLKYFSGELGRRRNERDASLLSGCVQAPAGGVQQPDPPARTRYTRKAS